MFLIILSCLSDAHRNIVVARFLSMLSNSDSGTAITKMEPEWHGRRSSTGVTLAMRTLIQLILVNTAKKLRTHVVPICSRYRSYSNCVRCLCCSLGLVSLVVSCPTALLAEFDNIDSFVDMNMQHRLRTVHTLT